MRGEEMRCWSGLTLAHSPRSHAPLQPQHALAMCLGLTYVNPEPWTQEPDAQTVYLPSSSLPPFFSLLLSLPLSLTPALFPSPFLPGLLLETQFDSDLWGPTGRKKYVINALVEGSAAEQSGAIRKVRVTGTSGPGPRSSNLKCSTRRVFWKS
eukprot:1987453-Rhodomonas_salina.1